MKKISLSVFAIALFINTASMSLALEPMGGSFSDVTVSTYYRNSINWMDEAGVINGYPDGTFKPDQCVNRVEFLKMMFKTFEIATSAYDATLFSDTPEGQWYTPYVKAAIARKTINGYPDGTFKPGQCVNRVEAIKMAVLEFNMGENPGAWGMYTNPYDVALVKDAWWKPYFATAMGANFVGIDHFVQYDADWMKLGIDNNFGNPTYDFGPGESMTRKEVAEMLYRMKAANDNNKEYYSEGFTPLMLKATFEPDCSGLGDSWISSVWKGNDPLAFCYKTTWGTPELKDSSISPEARIGQIYYVTFSKADGNSPLLGYSTLDFQKLGDSDVSEIANWDAIDFSKSEAELAELFPENENPVVEKIVINDKQILKVSTDYISSFTQEHIQTIYYLAPKVSINGTDYNLFALGGISIESDLKKVMESMRF